MTLYQILEIMRRYKLKRVKIDSTSGRVSGVTWEGEDFIWRLDG